MIVPVDLLDFDHWLVWRYERAKKGDKPTKVPYEATSGHKASSTNPATWAPYQVAQSVAQDYNGLGFVFAEADPFVGIDLDHCRDKATGDIEQWAWLIISQVNSYTEISPSGTGVHILVRGVAPHCGKTPIAGTDGSLEMYDRGRYFTVTGKRLDGTPDSIMLRQGQLDTLFTAHFKPIPAKAPTSAYVARGPLGTEDLLDKILGSAQGEKFQRLMTGDTTGYPSRSEAHEALFAILAWWTKDPEQIKQIALTSGLADHPNFQRDSYMDRSIAHALALVGNEGYQLRPLPPARTELGNAQRLVARCGEDLRYCYAWKTWMVWNGRHWQEDDRGVIMFRAKETARAIFGEAEKAETTEEATALAKWAIASQSAKALKAMIELAQSELPITTLEFDQNPWLFNCQNGTINLKTGQLQPHSRADYLTKISAVAYDPLAHSATWDRYIAEAMGGNAGMITFLQRAAGYSLTGDTTEEVMFLLHGPPVTGKSTFLDATKAALGGYAQVAQVETFMQQRNPGGPRDDLAMLPGVRFVSASEGNRGQRFDHAIIKQITGGDAIRARHLFSKSFEFKPAFKLWLAANDAPKVHDDDAAMWRRILRIPFDHSPAQRDPAVKMELCNPQIAGPAVLAWMVQGCLDWQRDGLAIPTEVRDATQAYQAENDPLKDFLAECCIAHDEAFVPSKVLYTAYQTWCKENTIRSNLTQKMVSDRMVKRGFLNGTNRYLSRVDRGFFGVGLRADADETMLATCNECEAVTHVKNEIRYTSQARLQQEKIASSPDVTDAILQSVPLEDPYIHTFTERGSVTVFDVPLAQASTGADAVTDLLGEMRYRLENGQNGANSCAYLPSGGCHEAVVAIFDDLPMCQGHYERVMATARRQHEHI